MPIAISIVGSIKEKDFDIGNLIISSETPHQERNKFVNYGLDVPERLRVIGKFGVLSQAMPLCDRQLTMFPTQIILKTQMPVSTKWIGLHLRRDKETLLI
jgi:hypothetical protein